MPVPVRGWLSRRGCAGSATSHSRTEPSSLPLASVCPSGLNATELTAPAPVARGEDRPFERTPHPTDRRSTIAQMTPAGRTLTGKAINLLNSEFFRDPRPGDRESHLLIGLLMKMRRSWNDIENPDGWEPFEVGLDAPPA